MFQVQGELACHIQHPICGRGKEKGGQIDSIVVAGDQHEGNNKQGEVGQGEQEYPRRK